MTARDHGDLVVVRGHALYTSADEPDTVPAGRVPTRRRAQLPDGRPLNGPMSLGIRTWDDLPEAGTAVLIGTYPGALCGGYAAEYEHTR